jgi:hypothetical protein
VLGLALVRARGWLWVLKFVLFLTCKMTLSTEIVGVECKALSVFSKARC